MTATSTSLDSTTMDDTSICTQLLSVHTSSIELRPLNTTSQSLADGFTLHVQDDASGSVSFQNLSRAAMDLKTSLIPVAFPTETVYGLGADATRSEAVRGIYRAKKRPSDNPLIVHVHSLPQLRALLRPQTYRATHPPFNISFSEIANQDGDPPNSSITADTEDDDPIPAIYHALIRRFWPGALTILLPNPRSSVLAPEVTAGQPTFGARMPNNTLALALLKLADIPLAAPSANASSKPSPTDAEHVLYDLDGRISLIVDGGPCEVGVESTVVDGLCDPPVVLRPGGVSLAELRSVPGWEGVMVAYKDASERNDAKPRAPGMKYRHYSPKAPVVLFESGRNMPGDKEVEGYVGAGKKIGIVRTVKWPRCCSLGTVKEDEDALVTTHGNSADSSITVQCNGSTSSPSSVALAHKYRIQSTTPGLTFDLWDIELGNQPEHVARGLFSALRELDRKDVDAILVEGIDDSRGDVSVAVMNRLRKAAEVNLR